MTTSNNGGSLDDQRRAARGEHRFAGRKAGAKVVAVLPFESAAAKMRRVAAAAAEKAKRKGRKC